ncbi:hypothetical protein ROHU_005429 [Labeo rohita]|uniref:Uncharacterized protein n=1 Tax=Labeo rohita TaxID=84645 RepID=A0A498NAS3_LABRO|nr:hypothetical protein ROHU_005429 [Labeo rohita]
MNLCSVTKVSRFKGKVKNEEVWEPLKKAAVRDGIVPENVKVCDESGTEVDDDRFEDVVRDPSVGFLTIKHGAGQGTSAEAESGGPTIEQDLFLVFGEGVTGKLLEKWTTAFKKTMIQQCKKLPSTSDLKELNLLLVTQKRVLILSGTNIEEHLREITAIAQPYLLAVGPQKNSVHQYFIVFDWHAIPCKAKGSLSSRPFQNTSKSTTPDDEALSAAVSRLAK